VISTLRTYIYVFLPILVFSSVQLYFRSHQDRSDLPGAAGSWSIYLGAVHTPKGDFAARIYDIGFHWFSILSWSGFCSFLMGSAVVMGTTLFTKSMFNNKAALYSGLLIACWAPLHVVSLLYGNDPFSLGLGVLGIGIFFWGIQQENIVSLLISMLGICLLPIAVWAKELALPLFPLLLLSLIHLSAQNRIRSLFVLPILCYCLYWSYAWFWPTRTGALPTQNFDLILGVQKLWSLSADRLNEGKFVQLLLLCSMGLLWVKKKHRFRITAIYVITILTLGFTIATIGYKLRPRYLIVFGLPLFAMMSSIIASLRSKFLILSVGVILLLLDTWSYQYALSTAREKWMNISRSTISVPPTLWQQQYHPIPTKIIRDLSLLGAGSIIPKLQQNTAIASLPLRDERHRSLLAYAQVYGGSVMIIDPQKCCTIEDEFCAQTIISALNQAGIDLYLPHHDRHSPRIAKRSLPMYTLLLSQIESKTAEDSFWRWKPANSFGGHVPCQQPIDRER